MRQSGNTLLSTVKSSAGNLVACAGAAQSRKQISKDSTRGAAKFSPADLRSLIRGMFTALWSECINNLVEKRTFSFLLLRVIRRTSRIAAACTFAVRCTSGGTALICGRLAFAVAIVFSTGHGQLFVAQLG